MNDGGPRAERGAKRVRAFLGGHVVVDTTTPVLVWEWPFYPTYHLPVDDVLATVRPCGDDRYDVVTPGPVAPGAARRTRHVVDGVECDLVRLDWAAMDAWWEEDEPVSVHPRDPGVRVDVLPSSRHVVAAVDGAVLVDSRRPSILFETRLPPRFYVPRPDVRLEKLHASPTVTHCPYKGAASYWSYEGYEDLLWTYPAPLPESQRVLGLVGFWTEKVDLWLDGVVQDRPRTHFVDP